MPRQTKVEFWTKQVEEQKAWIAKCGGDLAGYVANYGSKDDPKHSGDGGEAIFQADTNALKQYEENLASAQRRAGKPLDGGTRGMTDWPCGDGESDKA